jgi:hypothetical protein
MRGKNKHEAQSVCTDDACRPLLLRAARRAAAKYEVAIKASPQLRRVQIAKMYGVPISWVMLEVEITSWRASRAIANGNGGFATTVKASVARTLRKLVSHFRHYVIPGR